MIRYGVVREEYALDGGIRVAYGIAVYAEENAAVVASVRDVSSDRATVERFVKQCEQLALSPLHLSEAVEDLLGE